MMTVSPITANNSGEPAPRSDEVEAGKPPAEATSFARPRWSRGVLLDKSELTSQGRFQLKIGYGSPVRRRAESSGTFSISAESSRVAKL